ncbi:hypothetical protein N5D45_06680 [Stenotrophomonas sp. GD03819]|nr:MULTISPECIES: hypothetical protein [Stenotrophomonas]KDE89438.1 hypothetical protein DF40_015465 [Stenotrophomonas maltophilia M30]MBA0233276.1 hypothetical protein [Stenotrophomonas maltophilia]MBA0267315.1 hypothetical protein [Stenotrophomonas maltophilia]MBA0455261.1 hypothetical protein [Stenotrophomonas maltophilia]MDH1791504.1 hypothetical protein [Stenotrophomonas sp. GD03819]
MKLHYANKPAQSTFTRYALRAALYAAIAFNIYGVFYVFCVEENDPMIYEQTVVAAQPIQKATQQMPDVYGEYPLSGSGNTIDEIKE